MSKATDLNISEIKVCEKALKVKSWTHSQIAHNYLQSYGEKSPISSNGALWVYDQDSGLWQAKDLSKVAAKVGKEYDSHSKCITHSDYKSIANLVYDETHDEHFFDDASQGINTPSGFYTVKDNALVCTKITHQDKARFRLDISPQPKGQINEFMNMLEYAFGDTFQQQARQLRMFFGLSLIGMQASIHRACFLVGVGGSGKSTILRILQALIPVEFTSHISPLELDCDYKRACLADKLLNLVPEIDKVKVISSAEFKTITGEDETHARHPYGRVFNFTSSAGNWFNGNFYITTKDHSDGFYRRWALFKFIHARPQNERDPMLTKRIIDNELPGILAWAFDGVRDYLHNGLYLSPTHDASMEEWKTDGNSALSWLSDEENGVYKRSFGDKSAPLRKIQAYKKYTSWCYSNNRKPFARKVFYAFIEENGFCVSKSNGNDCFTDLTCEQTPSYQNSVIRMPF